MGGAHEQDWAAALAQEHAHQRELLATLRDELGAFARECAAALSSLDDYVDALGGVTAALEAAREAHEHASLVLEVGQRLPELAPTTVPRAEDVSLYESLAADADVPQALVGHAGELLRSARKRTDRELLQAVVEASGVRSRIEAIIGPAPSAALTAMRPLARRLPALSTVGDDAAATVQLEQVLEATAKAVAPEAAQLAGSLRATVDHVQAAARAIEEGKLEQVLAEARRVLEADLDALRAVIESALDAPADWLEAHREEHAELTEEVREKLERIERIRRVLAAFLPHLQLITRALATVERLRALERRLGPGEAAGLEAARLLLLLDLRRLWEAIQPPARRQPARAASRNRTRMLIVAVLVVAAVILAIVLLSGGDSDAEPAAAPEPAATAASAPTAVPSTPTSAPTPSAPSIPTTPSTPTTTAPTEPAPPAVTPVSAVFDEAQRATFYAVGVAPGEGTPTYTWELTPPDDNPECDDFEQVADKPEQAVWRHADTDGCTHIGSQHLGTVTVTVTTTAQQCVAAFRGTLTDTGPAPKCQPIRN